MRDASSMEWESFSRDPCLYEIEAYLVAWWKPLMTESEKLNDQSVGAIINESALILRESL